MKQTFGEKLLFYRKASKFSQQRLGKQIGYSQRTISNWETNIAEPNIEAIRKIVKILDIRYEDLQDD